MKSLLILILFLFFNTANAQVDNWLGHWQGELHISGTSEVVKMQLIISVTEIPDKWNWIIVYGNNDTEVRREYNLLATDDLKHFILDENNSIELDFFYNKDAFHSNFIVMNNFLSSSYRLEDNKLYFQVITSSLNDENITGGEGDVPEVKSIKIHNTQFAILTRK